MEDSKIKIIILTILLGLIAAFLSSAEVTQNITILKPGLAVVPPKIDGMLDDSVWKSGPIVDDIFITYNPLYGDVLPQKTTVYMAYDSDNLYFAFYCYDTEPNKIKTSITKHDNMWGDDWVGFAIDMVGSRQFAYEFFINPNGIQGDILNSSSTGEDSSPDYIWESGGKIVDDGYIVEVKIPLKNFRFVSGDNAEMNILFWRRINRLAISGSWPELKPGESILSSSTKVIYGKLNKQLVLEFLPSITYGSIWDRESPEKWSDPDGSLEFGITGKYGITSSIATEFTYNPDFSQVESDVFQVLVNQRYPIFYSEKRPFFMEIGNMFDIAGTGNNDYNMRRAMHTRAIVDPEWGIKLSGELGNIAFGLFGAVDEWPGREYADGDEINIFEGENANYLAGRMKYSLGKGNYIGMIYSGKDFADGYNRVLGADLSYRLGRFSVSGNFLHSITKDEETIDETNGSAWTVAGSYSSKSLGTNLCWEHLDTDFRMDTAFLRRRGMDKITAYFGPSFYPEGEKWSWLKRLNPFVWGYHIHDLETGEDDYFYVVSLRSFFLKGWMRIDYRKFSEFWAGEQLSGGYFYTQGSAQWTKWLRMYAHLGLGDGIYYDEETPFVGNRINFNIDCTIQLNDKFSQFFDYTYIRMDSKTDGSKVYDVNIVRSRTTYQFDKYFFLRAVIQYDSYREIVLTDLLLSYQLNPQTVLHLGYGSLHENMTWRNDEWQDPDELAEYYQTTQSIFFKASYLLKF